MRLLLLLVAFIALSQISTAQTSNVPTWAYRVSFKNKSGTLSFADSLQFLSSRALARRHKQAILLDSSDLPVSPNYIAGVMQLSGAFRLHVKSKWMNQIVIMVTDTTTIAAVRNLPYVQQAKMVGYFGNGYFRLLPQTDKTKLVNLENNAASHPQKRTNYGFTFGQLDQIKTTSLHDSAYTGNGMLIAILDDYFTGFDTMPCFQHVWQNNKLVDTANIARPRSMSNPIQSHGKDGFALMAAYVPGLYVGASPDASYALYITEDLFVEQPIEADNWLAGAERADSIGADIINSSLGYNQWDNPFGADSYTYNDLTGNVTTHAKALNKAAQKGMICVNAMGNAGVSAWFYMLTPADADSCFSVGMVDTNGNYGYGSSHGPSKDGRVKPDACAMGYGAWLMPGNGNPAKSNGTSFAAPIMSGSIACLWQALPDLTAYEIKKIVRESCHLYNNPNDSLGYGIPNFKLALQLGRALQVDHIGETNINSNVYVFPSPVEKVLTIKNLNAQNKTEVLLYDINGKILIKDQFNVQKQFDLSNYAGGEYLLEIKTNDAIIRKKIIKS